MQADLQALHIPATAAGLEAFSAAASVGELQMFMRGTRILSLLNEQYNEQSLISIQSKQ